MQETPKPQKQKPTNTNYWTKNIVTDPNAPQYYSLRAIWGFSVFFTVIFGAVLLAANLTDKKAKWTVIGFGILYTTLAIVILNMVPLTNTGLTFGINAIGALILTQVFWKKHLGETKFRTKPIWKPLIISIIIMIPFLLAIFYSV